MVGGRSRRRRRAFVDLGRESDRARLPSAAVESISSGSKTRRCGVTTPISRPRWPTVKCASVSWRPPYAVTSFSRGVGRQGGGARQHDSRARHADHAAQSEVRRATSDSRLCTQDVNASAIACRKRASAVIAEIHERELRSMMTAMQAVQLHRDAEIMATLGSVLSRHVPGAPASIYYRRLVAQVRRFVDQHVPSTARTLVATYGDDALLQLGERQAEPFPYATPGVSADYTDVTAAEAVAQLEAFGRVEQISRRSQSGAALAGESSTIGTSSHPAIRRHCQRTGCGHDLGSRR